MADTSKTKTVNGLADNTKPIAVEERWHMIAEAAYCRAVNRGFQNGDPVDDWLTAEREIDTLLLSQPTSGVKTTRKTALVARPTKTPNAEDAGSRARR